MSTSPRQIGRTVKDVRRSLGITQRQLALAAGTGLRFIIDLEQGKETCQLGKAITVLDALGIRMVLQTPDSI